MRDGAYHDPRYTARARPDLCRKRHEKSFKVGSTNAHSEWNDCLVFLAYPDLNGVF